MNRPLASSAPTAGPTGRSASGTRSATRDAHRLADRLDALDDVVEQARGRLDDDVVAEAERIAERAGTRSRLGADHIVVALAGATGSGKSSVFNALSGDTLSPVGLRRPTTDATHAAVRATRPAGELLDWLQVPRRHVLAAEDDDAAAADGLVLLDLPDVDSVEQRNREQAERLVARADVLVWVLDPQKYADAALHERYLSRLAGHAGVVLVVLNQIDRLTEPARRGCLADLERLLREEGLGAVPVFPVSARTGEGLPALRADLAKRVAARRAWWQRLDADLTEVAGTLEQACGPRSTARVDRGPRQAVVSALTDAAGADVVAAAVARSYRLRARRATGWPVTRWTVRLRRDPARRLRLRDEPSELVRTSLPGPSAVQQARTDAALRDLATSATAGSAPPWPGLVRRAATGRRDELPDLLDRTVASTDLGVGRRPLWWRLVGALQWVLAAAAVVGLLWLAGLVGLAWLKLPEPPLPDAGPVPLPVPTVLLIGGLLCGALLAVLARPVAAVGARRAARRARRRLADRIAAVVRDVVLDPVDRELAVHAELCRAVARVRG